MFASESWYLTVVRTQGLLFIRPDKSWQPIVSVAVVDPQQSHEVVLGCDGQNPNQKAPFTLRGVDHTSFLDVKLWHKSRSKKRKKRHLVGSAYITLREVLQRQERPGSDVDIRLSCPTSQKRSPTIGGRQQRSATLTVRLVAPEPIPSTSPTNTASDDDILDEDELDRRSTGSSSHSPSETLVPASQSRDETSPDLSGLVESGLRRRKKPRIKGYHIDSESDCDGSSSAASSCPPTPRDDDLTQIEETKDDDYESYFPHHERSYNSGSPTTLAPPWGLLSAFSLPRHVQDHDTNQSIPLSFLEACVDCFAPYRELRDAVEDAEFDKVLSRLLMEWYVVAASLLALTGIDAAVFGLAPGSILPIGGFAQHAVAFGAIAAGLGLVSVSWFLVLYAGANTARFRRVATDVYGSYFFFSLTCRAPTLCMFLSALALMLFLLSVAWAAWSTAVLVMSCFAGVLFSMQYLIFGCHRAVNFCVWIVRTAWRAAVRREVAAADARPAPEVRAHEGGRAHAHMVPDVRERMPASVPTKGAIVHEEIVEVECEG
ncbi:uncharacterized protein FIBRA_01070 [Fibroporia radiculosa]|uniref:C2 domain-containing protein n=1 Tax=Fibroporia radiculosa TaxID=599839 RepID=J4H0W5_9APHY|nr:uncharacterized protein FIBRA_01070 [Fibroporia radiculosa]CCL99059.1 predicted protein [Fibroporia radiculosa]